MGGKSHRSTNPQLLCEQRGTGGGRGAGRGGRVGERCGKRGRTRNEVDREDISTLQVYQRPPRNVRVCHIYQLGRGTQAPKGLIIIFPTRYGKTVWARSIHTDHAHWNVDCTSADAKLLIFDNVPMSELLHSNRYRVLMGMENHFSITGKYRRRKPEGGGRGSYISAMCGLTPLSVLGYMRRRISLRTATLPRQIEEFTLHND